MLDASASILSLHHKTSEIQLVPMERLINHSDWTIYACNTKSSKTAKRYNTVFYEDVAKLIELKCCNRDNRVLVVGSGNDVGNKQEPLGLLQRYHKECCEKYKKQLSFVNFEAMRGKNTWSAYNIIIIMHTPCKPAWYYPLVFKFYNPDYYLDDIDIQTSYSNQKGFEHPCFRNKKLDDFRETEMADYVYQAIRRINRDNYDEAEVYYISSDQKILKILEPHLLGVRIKEYTLASKRHAKEKKREYSRKEESPVRVRFKELLVEMVEGKHREHECADQPGYYYKKWCMSQIGCGGHFSRYLNSVKEYMAELAIEHSQHKIIVNKFSEKD